MKKFEFDMRKTGIAGTLLLVFSCFTLSTSGYLAWLYHLMTFVAPETVDALSMGLGYACQGLGIAVAAVLLRACPEAMGRVAFVALIALHFTCAAPASLSDSLGSTLAFGYAMNLLCGVIAAFYLLCLASLVPKERRGIVFGGGYALSIVASWLVSLASGPIGGISVELVACAVFSVVSAAVVMATPMGESGSAAAHSEKSAGGKTLRAFRFKPAEAAGDGAKGSGLGHGALSVVALTCIAVLLMSMVKNMGFNFPTADIGSTIDLEMSRLFYAGGLVVAGLVFDRNRKFGTVLCMAALIVPFSIMALVREPVPSAALWAVDYFFYGFFAVFRIVLFADLAADDERLELSGFGLMLGRFGDALGITVCLSLGGNAIALVAVAAVLFAATVFVFYQLFNQLYPEDSSAVPARSEREVFDTFTTRYDLSPREREVVRLALDDKANAEIAATLFVSESTVKFHMRNALKKTNCKNRMELLAKYAEEARVG